MLNIVSKRTPKGVAGQRTALPAAGLRLIVTFGREMGWLTPNIERFAMDADRNKTS